MQQNKVLLLPTFLLSRPMSTLSYQYSNYKCYECEQRMSQGYQAKIMIHKDPEGLMTKKGTMEYRVQKWMDDPVNLGSLDHNCMDGKHVEHLNHPRVATWARTSLSTTIDFTTCVYSSLTISER